MCGNCECGHQEEPTLNYAGFEEIADAAMVQDEIAEAETCGDNCSCGCEH
jgi:hypothetical protein